MLTLRVKPALAPPESALGPSVNQLHQVPIQRQRNYLNYMRLRLAPRPRMNATLTTGSSHQPGRVTILESPPRRARVPRSIPLKSMEAEAYPKTIDVRQLLTNIPHQRKCADAPALHLPNLAPGSRQHDQTQRLPRRHAQRHLTPCLNLDQSRRHAFILRHPLFSRYLRLHLRVLQMILCFLQVSHSPLERSPPNRAHVPRRKTSGSSHHLPLDVNIARRYSFLGLGMEVRMMFYSTLHSQIP
jgi:hypothetical protein